MGNLPMGIFLTRSKGESKVVPFDFQVQRIFHQKKFFPMGICYITLGPPPQIPIGEFTMGISLIFTHSIF